MNSMNWPVAFGTTIQPEAERGARFPFPWVIVALGVLILGAVVTVALVPASDLLACPEFSAGIMP